MYKIYYLDTFISIERFNNLEKKVQHMVTLTIRKRIPPKVQPVA